MLASTRQWLFINVALRQEERSSIVPSPSISLPFFTRRPMIPSLDRNVQIDIILRGIILRKSIAFFRFIEASILLRIAPFRSVPFDTFRCSAHTCLQRPRHFPAEFASSLAFFGTPVSIIPIIPRIADIYRSRNGSGIRFDFVSSQEWASLFFEY